MKIRYRGFKKRSGEFDLGKAALLQGDIGTGKSALVAAVHFGLVGKMASMRMGKGDTQDPGRMLKLAEDGAQVDITLNGVTVTRTLRATEKKAKVITQVGLKTGLEAEAEAARMAGDLIYADFGRLVTAGDTERAQILATYLPQPEDREKRWWAIAQAMCHMEAALKPPVKKGKANEPVIAGRMAKEEATALRERITTLAASMSCGDALDEAFAVFKQPDQSAEDVIEALRELANKAEQARQTAQKVALETAGVVDAVSVSPAEIPQLEAEVASLLAMSQDADRARAEYERYTADVDAKYTRLTSLKDRIAALAPKVGNADASNAAVKGARDALESHKRLEPTRPDLSAMRNLEVSVNDLARALADSQRLSDATQGWTLQLDAFRAEMAELEACAPARPDADPDVLATEIAQIRERLEMLRNEGRPIRQRWEAARSGVCPVMCRDCPTPDELSEFSADALTELTDKMEQVQALQNTLASLESARTEAITVARLYSQQVADWERRKAAIEGKIQHAYTQRTQATAAATDSTAVEAEYKLRMRELEMLRQSQESYQGAYSRWSEKQSKIHEQLLAAERAAAETAQALSTNLDLNNELQRVVHDLESLQSHPVEEPVYEDCTPELQLKQQRLDAAHAAKARAQIITELNIDGKTMAATVLKAAHKGASSGVINSIQAATTPIIDRITKALNRMRIPGEFIVDLDAKMFGLRVNGIDIDVETLSGGEKVLFAAAMLSALPSKHGTRVLTLESAELPDKWLQRLMEGLDVNAFDAVILASCHRVSNIPAGWVVVDMGERADG